MEARLTCDVLLEGPKPFGDVRLSLRTKKAQSWWSLPSTAVGYTSLDDSIKMCNNKVEQMGFGTYVAYDCNKEMVCVVQHPFEHVRPHLEDGRFPFPIVKYHAQTDFPCDTGPLTSTDQRRLLDAIFANRYTLFAPNVVALIASGTRIVGGVSRPEPCIRAVVWAKGFVPLGGWLLPRTVGLDDDLDFHSDIPVDVVEGMPITVQSAYSGIEIQVYPDRDLDPDETKGECATFTGVVRRLGDDRSQHGRRYGVTVGHVFRKALLDGGPNPSVTTGGIATLPELIGTLDSAAIRGGVVPNILDAALIALEDGGDGEYTCLSPSTLTGWKRKGFGSELPRLRACSDRVVLQQPLVPPGTLVYKYGAATRFTKGTMFAQGYAVSFYHNVAIERNSDGDPVKVATFQLHPKDCLFIYPKSSAFSDKGDSGALVFTVDFTTNDATAVGMLFAGNPRVSLAFHIHDVEDALGVRFVFCEEPDC
jgi:hypothetical protein